MPWGGGLERLRARDPGLRAVRRSARVTLVACTGFYAERYGLGNHVAAVYALFGAIASGGMSFAPGTPRERARTLLAALPVAAAWEESPCRASSRARPPARAHTAPQAPPAPSPNSSSHSPACAYVRTRLPTVDADAGLEGAKERRQAQRVTSAATGASGGTPPVRRLRYHRVRRYRRRLLL